MRREKANEVNAWRKNRNEINAKGGVEGGDKKKKRKTKKGKI